MLRSLRHNIIHTTEHLEERGVEIGRPLRSSLNGRENPMINRTNSGTKNNTGGKEEERKKEKKRKKKKTG